jgi:hypothetical protein
LKDLQDAFQSLIDQFEGVTPEIMLNAVQPTFQKSQEYCPTDTGALKSSGYAEITSTARGGRVEVGYAKGGSPPYAVYVHENLSNFHRPPTRAKWLQAAMLEDLTSIFTRIQNGYYQFMGR